MSDDANERAVWTTLCRIALLWPRMAGEIFERSRGLIGDFRIARILQQISERHGAGGSINPVGLSMEIQGSDLSEWVTETFFGFNIETICEEDEAPRLVEDRIRYLSSLKTKRHLEEVSGKANAALAAGRQSEYLDLLSQQQALRRKLKAITY